MSVAFRRDSDEEHPEPKFERPIPAGPNLVTPRGLVLIEGEIAELERKLAAAKDEATFSAIKRDLRYWQTREITAEVQSIPTGRKVEFGVKVRALINGKLRTLSIVGDDEADPTSGLISFKAPLSKAMLGAQAGETLPFGAAVDAIEILEIGVGTDGFGVRPAWRA